MAAAKTMAGPSGVTYAVVDAHGNKATLVQGQMSFVGANPTVQIAVGGNTVTLTKQNVIDLLAPLTGFTSTGVLS